MKLKKRKEKSPSVFIITEKPVTIHNWNQEQPLNHLEFIENDIRILMRQLAETKQSLSEQQRLYDKKMKAYLLDILEVLDSFKRVFQSIEKRKKLVEGKIKIWISNFHTIQRQLQSSLTKIGVEKIENLDKGFDPNWHKASELVQDPSKHDGFIIEEIKQGYFWKKDVLRKSEVVVVRNN